MGFNRSIAPGRHTHRDIVPQPWTKKKKKKKKKRKKKEKRNWNCACLCTSTLFDHAFSMWHHAWSWISEGHIRVQTCTDRSFASEISHDANMVEKCAVILQMFSESTVCILERVVSTFLTRVVSPAGQYSMGLFWWLTFFFFFFFFLPVYILQGWPDS